ncbi:hypothetical protein D3C84_1025550 [compost metagenome]
MQGRLYRERGLLGDTFSQCNSPWQLLANGYDLLHEIEPQCFGGVELVTGQQELHCVAPAGTFNKPERRTAASHDAALDLNLGKAAILRGDDDVGRQH